MTARGDCGTVVVSEEDVTTCSSAKAGDGGIKVKSACGCGCGGDDTSTRPATRAETMAVRQESPCSLHADNETSRCVVLGTQCRLEAIGAKASAADESSIDSAPRNSSVRRAVRKTTLLIVIKLRCQQKHRLGKAS